MTMFTTPEWWPLLLLGPLAAVLLGRLARARRQRLADLAGPRLASLSRGPRAGRPWALPALVAAAALLAAVAALRPAWGEGEREVEQRGVDLVVCLDVSRSMLARDVPPSRLARAHREIRALAERARGDRLALVVFAGEARLAVPLTRDLASFADLADAADPLSVPRGGTDLGAALRTALGALSGRTGESEAVVLVTDGEDLSGEGLRAARECGGRGIVVHAVGLGTAAGGKITLGDGGGAETFLRDRQGRDVVTTMDASDLRRIAAAAGGEFVDASTADDALVSLYEDRVLPLSRRAFDAERRRERTPRFQWPLFGALALWMLELWWTGRS